MRVKGSLFTGVVRVVPEPSPARFRREEKEEEEEALH